MQGLVEDVFPAGLAADLGLLVLADTALASNHDAAASVTLEALESRTAGTEETTDKVVVGVLLRWYAKLDTLANGLTRDMMFMKGR